MRRYLPYLAPLMLVLVLIVACEGGFVNLRGDLVSRAAFESGCDYVDADTARIWVDAADAGWADVHYRVNGGGQLNVRMNRDGTSFWYDVNGLSEGDVIDYWFTIGFDAGAQDTGWYSYTHTAGGSTPTPTPAGSTTFVIEAEDYAAMSGVQTESCVEGGLNVGWIDAGDWMAYASRYFEGGEYLVEYRVASLNGGGQLSADLDAGSIVLGSVSIPSTGGWQNWTTVSHTVTIPAGNHAFGIYAVSGGWNINWIRFTYLGGSGSTPTPTPSSSPRFIPLSPGMELTIQFLNKTGGRVDDSRIYAAIIGRDGGNRWCYLTPEGTATVIGAGDTSEQWFFRLDTIAGFQVPPVFTSARLYMSIDSPLVMSAVVDATGSVGIVQPDLGNPSDPNQDIIFDWAEFTVHSGTFWGNTTQVDQFGFPYTLAVYSDGGTLVKKVGIDRPRDEVFSLFDSYVPSEFRSLNHYPYRILAPAKGSFGEGKPNASYFDAYVDTVWNQYRTQTLTITHPLGTFQGRVLSDDRMEFTRLEDGQKFYIQRRPNDTEIFEGSGVLASGNTVELALEAWICAAFNRHVVHYPDSSYWNNPAYYYLDSPANWYAAFWHEISLGGLAYGFCYDDVNDQSTLIEAPNVRAVVIELYW
ncbi:Carbohydrate binding family 6 [Spirochaeta thermophila DSM 6578]|uniref:Carbohydrate binding family 6 n=1 Tax=Winmispira thermophila (strain ATCC 700085 / DSM 6578 / Z-1203) TaxID=869211 RepID=G0G9T7_WINT7|nr:beta-1,3-glucanase family protein [Spirochaeta thermophila]AEJ60837.1 Carbohydrate binding family 6 [Spirochaeta thermophila DSM 6578]